MGFDTPKYLWRANLVASGGLRALPEAPLGVFAHPDRPGYPVVVGTMGSAFGASSFLMAFVLPSVVGAIVGLAAGALAVGRLGFPRWTFPVFGAVVGTWPGLVLTASGHADHLLMAGAAMAAVPVVLSAVDGERGTAAAVMLLAAAVVLQWQFAALFLALLLALAVVLLPGSARLARAGGRSGAGIWMRTPSGRLAIVVVGAGALGAAALFVLAPHDPIGPDLSREAFERRLGTSSRRYLFAVTGPLAAVGLATLLWGSRRRRGVEGPAEVASGPRRAAGFLALWAGTAAVAVALLSAGAAVPAHRIVASALAIGVLVAAGVVALARVSIRLGRPVLASVAAAATAGLVVLGGFAREGSAQDTMEADALAQARTAGRYLETSAGDRPAVFLVRPTHGPAGPGAVLADHVTRASMPDGWVTRIVTYLGPVSNLRAGRPTLPADDPAAVRIAERLWEAVEPVLGDDPVVLALGAFNGDLDALAGEPGALVVAPGVVVVDGPPPGAGFEPAPDPSPPSPAILVVLAAGCVILLAGVGSGWARRSVAGDALQRLALAPAFGLAAIVLVGLPLAALGLRPSGRGGLAILGAAAAIGWVPRRRN